MTAKKEKSEIIDDLKYDISRLEKVVSKLEGECNTAYKRGYERGYEAGYKEAEIDAVYYENGDKEEE